MASPHHPLPPGRGKWTRECLVKAGSVTVHHWHWKLSIWLEWNKVLWVFSCERWKVLAEWKSQMKESGRRKARFCTALILEDPPIQREKYPARPITDMTSVISDTGHRLTCSVRVGATPAATAATNSCLAGFHGSAAVALNKWIIYWNTTKAGPSCLVRTPHLSHASQCCKAFLLGDRRGQLLVSRTWNHGWCMQTGIKTMASGMCCYIQFVSDKYLQLLIVRDKHLHFRLYRGDLA